MKPGATAMSRGARRCIYCLEVKATDAFNREHIMPQAFGTFVGAETDPIKLDCVCTECNQRFGDTIDRALARDSVLGLLRYNDGVRDPREFTPPSRASGLTITPVGAERDDGARYVLGAGRDGTFGFRQAISVGFATKTEGPYEYFSMDALPSGEEVRTRFGPRPAFMTRGVSRTDVDTLMAALGFRYGITHETLAPQRANVNIPIGRLQFRAIAKIAFNYFAWVMGAPAACMPDFNGLRAYIIRGERPGPTHVSIGMTAIDVLDAEGNARRGHFVTVQNSELGFLSQVSLFSTVRFRVDLTHVPLAVAAPCYDGHFYDLDARRVERVRVPPVVGGRIIPGPPDARIELGRQS